MAAKSLAVWRVCASVLYLLRKMTDVEEPPIISKPPQASDEAGDLGTNSVVQNAPGPTATLKPLPASSSALRRASSLQDCPRSEYIFVVVLGLCCAYTAGYSNGVALSGYLSVGATFGVAQPVAGVTNEYTVSAIAVAEGDAEGYKMAVGTILSSVAGSVISSVMNPRPVAFVLSPRYGPIFVVGSIFPTLGAVAALHNERREFFFTTIGNGILNGITSMYSANLLRTTSYSGPTTDIGIYFGQVLRGNRTNLWRLYILSGLSFAFWLGGLSGFEAAKFKRQYSLILNACIFATIGFSIICYFVVVHKVSFCEAIFGIGKWGIKFEKVTVKRRKRDRQSESDQLEGNGFVPGNSSLDEAELLHIFDELDSNDQGGVDQDALMSLLVSKDLVVKKHRRNIFGILYARMTADEHHKTGDWTITRDDWKRLINQNSSRRGFSTAGADPSRPSVSSVRSSIATLRSASIMQLEASGLHVIAEDEVEEEDGRIVVQTEP